MVNQYGTNMAQAFESYMIKLGAIPGIDCKPWRYVSDHLALQRIKSETNYIPTSMPIPVKKPTEPPKPKDDE